MKLSKFVRVYTHGAKKILFNSYNKAIVEIQKEYIKNNELTKNAPNDYYRTLDQMGFFIPDNKANELISMALNQDRRLIISVEISLYCNMRCPYCYQGTKKNVDTLILDENIKLLRQYCEKVEKLWSFEEVVLKILGGEPTIVWPTTKKIIDAIYTFCKLHRKIFNLMIDTNGVAIDDILRLEGYDSLLLTIPLTHKKCHDQVRKLANGQGSYDLIVSNIQRIHNIKPEICIIIRHNSDNENIIYFEDYIVNLKNRFNFKPIIDLSYTTELGCESYKNSLHYHDFIAWKSEKAIDILAQNDSFVTISPLMSTHQCQHRSLYSFKLFNDGTVGSCAMWFFNRKRVSLKDINEDISKLCEMKMQGKEQYSKCKTCQSFFLCGCGYNLPCIKSLNIPKCDADGKYIINLEVFLKKYIEYKKQGKDHLFIGFNGEIVIR